MRLWLPIGARHWIKRRSLCIFPQPVLVLTQIASSAILAIAMLNKPLSQNAITATIMTLPALLIFFGLFRNAILLAMFVWCVCFAICFLGGLSTSRQVTLGLYALFAVCGVLMLFLGEWDKLHPWSFHSDLLSLLDVIFAFPFMFFMVRMFMPESMRVQRLPRVLGRRN